MLIQKHTLGAMPLDLSENRRKHPGVIATFPTRSVLEVL
jgi:hypothetical protein